jgi:hypothetical protein
MQVKFAIALLVACGFLGCAGDEGLIPDLACEIDREPTSHCTAVPSLVTAHLDLFSGGTFKLVARYEACYRLEEIEMEGKFKASPHVSGVDLELLAEKVSREYPDSEQFSRTVGTISLDPKTWDGRFTDTAMTIRSRGSVGSAPPVLAMSCSKK